MPRGRTQTPPFSCWVSPDGSPGQLEAEIAIGSWITVPATEEILFDVPPEERYDYALSQIGISREQLEASEEQAGHA